MQYTDTEDGKRYGVISRIQSGGWAYFVVFGYSDKEKMDGRHEVYSSGFDKHYVGRFPCGDDVPNGSWEAIRAGVDFVKNGFRYPGNN